MRNVEWGMRNETNAECGMGNAELKGKVAREMTLTLTFRTPHSEFRIRGRGREC